MTEVKPVQGDKKPAEAAVKKAPAESGAAAAATGSDNGAAQGKKKPPEGQAADKGKGNKGCTPGEAGCQADAGAAKGAGAVSQEKTGSIGDGGGAGAADSGNGGKPAQVQTGQPADAKCTPAMKKAGKC